MSFDVAESAEFRLHIRRLLYNYSITHLTTNYLTFTENLVSEFIEYLQPIPLTDPYSLVLSVDPFQTFSQLHALSSLKPYDETPQTTKEALSYLKKATGVTGGKLITERIVSNDNYYETPPNEPFLPALTRRALQNTPKLGKNTNKPHSSKEHVELLKAQKINAIPVEPIQEEILSPEDILDLKCQIQPEEVKAVRSLLQTTADMLRPQKSYKNKYLDPDFLQNVPFQEPSFPDDPFMPIFPKARRPRSGAVNPAGHLPDLKGFEDIPNVVLNKIEVEDPDGDISRQNLVIIDGWETIRSSPPSPPISSDNEDQLDQLFLTSSPNTEPSLTEELMSSKMEPILIPRTRKIGGRSGVAPHILAGKTLSTFLQPLLSMPKAMLEPVALSEKNTDDVDQRPRASPTPSSLLGQPPSEMEDGLAGNVTAKVDIQDQDLDSELKVLYAGHDLEDVIMKEALDDKLEMMMDVPSLPAPNVHPPNDLHVPRTFSDLLIQPTGAAKSKDTPLAKKAVQPLQRFLKKVKGREPLALSLSWIPFTVDKKLPSATELLGVIELFNDDELAGEVNQPKMEALLKSLDLSDECSMDERWKDFDTLNSQAPPAPVNFGILLTRQERQRLARLENRLEDGVDCEDEELRENTDDVLELQDHGEADSGLISDEGQDDERPSKRARLEIDDPARGQDALQTCETDIDIAISESFHQLASPALSSASDDKENWPPLSLSSSLSKELRQDEDSADYYYYIQPLDQDADAWALSQPFYDGSEMLQMEDEESFEPLSFGSRQPALKFKPNFNTESYGSLSAYAEADLEADNREEQYLDIPMEASHDLVEHEVGKNDSVTDNVGSLALAFEPDIASRSLGIAAFAQLRARRVKDSKSTPIPVTAAVPAVDLPPEQKKTPEDIFDRETLRLPDDITVATSVHRYLASVELIQKHALVCGLRSRECAAELVERQSLDGVDLILDPHCAIIFLSLFVLPMRCESYVAKVAQQSWSFSRILVVFEAYPDHRAKRSSRKESHKSSTASDPYAYTPPIVKAIKKFRRDVNIAEGCGTKCPGTKVEYAFANTVEEAALFTRMYGDLAETRDEAQGTIWGEREWLGLDFSEDEEGRLAGLNGLNHFSASIVLCQVSLQDFVDMTPEERVDGFAGFIGIEPMTSCNADLDARLEVMHISSGPIEPDPGEMDGDYGTHQ